MIIAETAHQDAMRPAWVREVATEVEAVLNEGMPLRGVCLYPILSMPEWHSQDEWTHMGLWDLKPVDGSLKRELCQPMMEALREVRFFKQHARIKK